MSEEKFVKSTKNDILIVGYEGKKYSIEELKNQSSAGNKYKDNINIKNDYEKVYNNQSLNNLEGEIWVRLSQKGWTRYFVSNKGRVRWLNENNELIPLLQVDELQKNGEPHYGYLVFDPKQLPGKIQHGFHVWRLIAMGFLGLQKYDSRIVHHIDNNGYDCRPENLILVDWKQHSEIHGFDCRKE